MCIIKKIAIIGAGQMGHGIALIAAQKGKFNVILCDVNKQLLEKGLDSIKRLLDKSLEKERITEQDITPIIDRIHITDDLKEAVSNVDFIIEAVTENKEIKKELLQKIGNLATNKTTIVSNTSSISITELSESILRPEKFCGMHFFNPPHLMKLVEISKSKQTSEDTIQTVINVAYKMGKEIVVLKKDSPGFIVNRILFSALNEAVNIYASGIAGKEDIDKAIEIGLNWPIGPLKLIDQIGVDTVTAISYVLGNETDSKFLPNSILIEMKERGLLGKKAGMGFYEWKKNNKLAN